MNKIRNKLACTICGFIIEDESYNVFEKCKFCDGHYMPYSGRFIYVGNFKHARDEVKQIIPQSGGSRKYGNCELCGHYANEIYSYDNVFGHKHCLEEMIKHRLFNKIRK